MSEDLSEPEDGRSKMLLAILLIILLGSPGALLIFSMPLEVAPILLWLIIPVTLLFIVWYRQILIKRETYKREGHFY